MTAVAEISGCYLAWLVLTQHRSYGLLLPSAVSLALFAWLLTLHPAAAGRVYAAYGGMYIAVALAAPGRRRGADPLGLDRRVPGSGRHGSDRPATRGLGAVIN